MNARHEEGHVRRIVRNERAQSMVELGLLLPALMLIFLGIVDYGRFLYYNQAVVSSARAGADIAINHCVSHFSCGTDDTPATDDFIVQAVACDANPTVQLSPQPSTCSSCINVNCTSPTPVCDATCLAGVCQQDICVSPSSSTRVNGDDVSVSVGYRFKPIAPLMGFFFPDKACWAGDPASNHHTLCATSVGAIY